MDHTQENKDSEQFGSDSENRINTNLPYTTALNEPTNFIVLTAEEQRIERLKKPFWQRIDEQKYWLHITLFLITILTTSISGAFWVNKEVDFRVETWENILYGLPYSICLLLILTSHEFGHFFATVHHAVRASLPFFIPMPPIPILLNIGTFGAMIRTRERIHDSDSLFDIGVYGPLAGFVVAFFILLLGFISIPSIDYIYQIHPEYRSLGGIPELSGSILVGKNLLYWILEKIFYSEDLPPMTEMYHYPLLFAGWLGCFVTALNLLPIGQLDGGHIIYAMFGEKKQEQIAKVFLVIIIVLGLPSFLELISALGFYAFDIPFNGFEYPFWVREYSWASWMIWALILYRFIGIKHPPVLIEKPLNTNRMIIGWVSIVVFILCFTPVPFSQVP
ncbi:MAG: site-2 protease family protein [Chloroherpetonaceae bacterium]|nr:site-2 protease family protein [Chloroherpetonaceae bacterium]